MVLHARSTSTFSPARPELISAVYDAIAPGFSGEQLASTVATLANHRGLDLSELAFGVLGALRDAARAAAGDIRAAHGELQRLHRADADARLRLAAAHVHADDGGDEETEAELHVLGDDIALSRDELALAVAEQHQVLAAMSSVSSLAASALTHPSA